MAKKKKSQGEEPEMVDSVQDESIDTTQKQTEANAEGLTEKLFPELSNDTGYRVLPEESQPTEAEVDADKNPDVEAQAEPEPDAQPEAEPDSSEKTDETTEPEAPDYLDLDQVGAKILKRKVDGEEVEAPLSEWVKGAALERTLTKRLQKLAEERKTLAEEREKLKTQKLQFDQTPPPSNHEPEAGYENEETSSLRKELNEMRQAMSSLLNDTQAVRVQSNIENLSNKLAQDGFTDFKSYLPKMDEYVSNLKDDKQVLYYNTPDGAEKLYFMLKNKDLMASTEKQKESPKPQARPAPPIVKVGAGNAASASVNDDKQAQYKDLIRKANKTKSETDILKAMSMTSWD